MMTRPYYTLLWSLWRGNAPALGAIWVVSAASAGLWWFLHQGAVYFKGGELFVLVTILLWFSGLALIFAESSTRGLHFAFPVRRFPLGVGMRE